MRTKILVIEDDAAILSFITTSLEATGYEVASFIDGNEASVSLDKYHDYSLAIVDIMLPGKDGFELLPELQSYGVPVIFLTAKGELSDKVKGLTGGAEDYMVKPFEMLELLIRVDKILKRYKKSEPIIQIRDVVIDPEKRTVTKQGKEVYLKPMEFDCLMMLVCNRNKALTRKQLLGQLWGMEFEGETRTIDTHISRIRKKLDFQDVIKTIPRIGYRLEVDE
ncbi:MAG: response regulator transcription factor [Lachnospiraceae bacterium]|nr:response regulator transcription factor [Lachnospiraceae bacterium]